jgi:hypothetical protein
LQLVRPKCGHQFAQPQLKLAKQLNGMHCIECGQPITGALLSFGGYFACEPCVIAYYQQQGHEVMKQELRERRVGAARLLRLRTKV